MGQSWRERHPQRLDGHNRVTPAECHAGVRIHCDSHKLSCPLIYALTISGAGSLIATGGSNAAGIGGGYQSVCGNITIGSDVTQVIATKGDCDCDPIGAGKESSCGTVTIDGETITEDGVTIWTAGNATTHYFWDVSNNYKTWTLTKKEP